MPKIKILFFVESLCSGGKERRLVELIKYLMKHSNYELRLVLTKPEIHYSSIYELDIKIDVIERFSFKKDPSLFFRFYRITKTFDPNIIHTWGVMTTFYAIPTKVLLAKPLLGNLIADAPLSKPTPFSLSYIFRQISYWSADQIIGNSMAGFRTHGLARGPKNLLIYNGVHLERFQISSEKEKIKNQLSIHSQYIVIMVASATGKKDYDLFLDVAKELSKYRNDVTFLGVGDGPDLSRIKRRAQTECIRNLKLIGNQKMIEPLVNIADIGVLFTYSEGISNSIIEYMALGKPVITNDIHGASIEIIEHEKSGYVIAKSVRNITDKIIELLENQSLRKRLGEHGKRIVINKFNIDKMGNAYMQLYEKFASSTEYR